jgi:hypothetical protein
LPQAGRLKNWFNPGKRRLIAEFDAHWLLIGGVQVLISKLYSAAKTAALLFKFCRRLLRQSSVGMGNSSG